MSNFSLVKRANLTIYCFLFNEIIILDDTSHLPEMIS